MSAVSDPAIEPRQSVANPGRDDTPPEGVGADANGSIHFKKTDVYLRPAGDDSKPMKYQFIFEQHVCYSVSDQCRVLTVSRAGEDRSGSATKTAICRHDSRGPSRTKSVSAQSAVRVLNTELTYLLNRGKSTIPFDLRGWSSGMASLSNQGQISDCGSILNVWRGPKRITAPALTVFSVLVDKWDCCRRLYLGRRGSRA